MYWTLERDEQAWVSVAKKVLITPNEWFVPIEKAYLALEAEYTRLELDKTLTESMRNELFAQLIPSWGRYPNFNLQILEDREYMENLWLKYVDIQRELTTYSS